MSLDKINNEDQTWSQKLSSLIKKLPPKVSLKAVSTKIKFLPFVLQGLKLNKGCYSDSFHNLCGYMFAQKSITQHRLC